MAASGDCTTGLGADVTLDATDATQVYSAVAFADGRVNVAQNTVPASGFNVSVFNATGAAMTYADPLPYQALPTPVQAGDSASADFAAFTGVSLQVGASDFNNVAPAGLDTRPVITVIAADTLLVCAGAPGATSNCKVSTKVADQAYVRLANIAGDANGAELMCAHKPGASYPKGALAGSAAVPVATVSAFIPIDASYTNFKVTPLADCTKVSSAFAAFTIAKHGYYTWALTGRSGAYRLAQTETHATSGGAFAAVTLFNGIADATAGAAGFGASELTTDSALDIGALGAINTATTVSLTPDVASGLVGAQLVVTQKPVSASSLAVTYAAFAPPQTRSSSVSLWFGGDVRATPFVIACADDGSNVCVSTTGTLPSGPVAPN